MRSLKAALALVLVTFARGAAAQVPQPQPQRLPAATTSDTMVNALTVQNQRKVPVTVYMEHGNFDRRLGVVPPLQTTTLPLPLSVVQSRRSVALFFHPEGDATDYATREFVLTPPGRVATVVPASGNWSPPRPPSDTMTAVIPPDAIADATITVDNARDKMITVFARQGRADVRLGQVPPRSRATLRIPKAAVGPTDQLKLFVHPEGGMDLQSQTMQVRAGQHLALRIP